MKNLFFEELEKVEELGAFSDFVGAALPWIAGGIAVAIILTKFKEHPKPNDSGK